MPADGGNCLCGKVIAQIGKLLLVRRIIMLIYLAINPWDILFDEKLLHIGNVAEEAHALRWW